MDEIIKNKFDSLDCDIKELKLNDKEIYEKLGQKVNWSIYVWSFAILLAVVSGMFGLVYNKIEETQKDVSDINAKVSEISGYLSGIEITNE